LFDDHGIVGPGDADPIGDSQHVAIDRQAWHAEGVTEDDVGGLAADAWQGGEFLHRLWDLAGVVLDDLGGHTDERSGLGAEETGRLDLRLELVSRRVG
jgi:hypothetical protein